MVPYSLARRLSDWWNGLRDGWKEIPSRAGHPRPVPISTPHRDLILHRAQEVYAQEYLRLSKVGLPLPGKIAKTEAELTAMREARARALAALEEARRPLSAEEELLRWPGDEGRSDALVRKRRREGRVHRIRSATRQLDALDERIAAGERDLAADRALREKLHAGAVQRVRRFRHHTERRIALYLRALLRFHPDKDWAAENLGRIPGLPNWAESRSGEGAPSMSVSPLQPAIEYEIELTLPESVFGADCPEPFRLTEPGAAPRHFRLTREATGLRLRDFGHGNGPYIDGQLVKSALLAAGDHFDFGDQCYVVKPGCDRLTVFSLGTCDLVAWGLKARSGTRDRICDLSFVHQAGGVLAILGPSGAGKSSLFAALLGELPLAEGELYFEGLSPATHLAQIRERLGFVPQHDDLFDTLTVKRHLGYSYRLRTARKAVDERVDEVCAILELTDSRHQLVGTLSGGQRRRVSIAIELLSEPALLMLDEPTSGLDLGLDKEVMRFLNNYAAQGKTVVLVTHTPSHLSLAHRVLILMEGGRPVYFGEPENTLDVLGVLDYADLMTMLRKRPDDLAGRQDNSGQRYKEAHRAAEHAKAGHRGGSTRRLRSRRVGRRSLRQLGVLIRRQFEVLTTRGISTNHLTEFHRMRAVLTACTPLVIATLSAVLAALVTGGKGLGTSSPDAVTGLSLLTTLCVLSGQALTYSDLVAEHPIIKREHRTGVLLSALVVAKWLVFCAVAVLQALLMTVVFCLIRPGPAEGLVGNSFLELFAGLAALSIASMSLGLLISASVHKLEQAMAAVTASSVAQIALNGLTADLSNNTVLNILAWPLPDRWGVAAVAATVGIPGGSDALWQRTAEQWLFDMAVLAGQAAVFSTLALVVLRIRLAPARIV